jgi:hypothetical protein
VRVDAVGVGVSVPLLPFWSGPLQASGMATLGSP